MTDRRGIRERLERARIPGEREAEGRAWEVVRTAYAERTPAPATARYGRFAAALAGAAALAALVMSPAGAEVRDWISDVVEPGAKNPEPALTSLPTAGELLVESAEGPWTVDDDGSARRLGDYEQAAWSPTARFVAATSGHQLFAIVADAEVVGEPAGTPRWRVASPRPVSDPAWAPSGVRVAYRAGRQLRVVAGDGTDDALLAAGVSAVAPVWRPLSDREEEQRDEATGIVLGAANVLAFVDGGQRIHVVDVDSRRELVRPWSAGEDRIRALHWTATGQGLVIVTERRVIRLAIRGGRAIPGRSYSFYPARPVIAAPSPANRLDIAALTTRGTAVPGQASELLLLHGAGERSLQSGLGRFTDVAWSPDGRWLVLGWRDADQWLFIPARGGKPIAFADISAQFGGDAFPRITGWCCAD
jgi:WD40-like Beta Propeller Repeat